MTREASSKAAAKAGTKGKSAKATIREAIKCEERRIMGEAILQAASRAFNQLGYGGVTMEMIAAEAGISVGTIYNIFESKAALYDQILTAMRDRHWALVEEAVKLPGDDLTRARAFVRARATMFFENQGIVRDFIAAMMGRQEHLSAHLTSLPMEIMKDYIGKLTGFMKDMQARRGVMEGEDPRLMAFLFEGVVHSHFAYWKTSQARLEGVEELVDTIMRRIIALGYVGAPE